MAKVIIVGCFFIFLWKFCDNAYFDDQPKLLTENGNFVIESAVDRNVSFRLKGSSFLNINDVNIMNLVGSTNQSATGTAPNSNIAIRLSTLEDQFRQFQAPYRQNRIQRRLSALEQRIGGAAGSNTTWTNINRRIRQLEIKMQRIVSRLNNDNCTSNPCLNGGTCTNTFGGYMCRCPDTWTGSNCEEDVNECTTFANTDLGCQNSISCENTPGGYTCRCKQGWLGIHCTKRTADCAESSAYEMCGHGVCVHTNDPTSYRCICDQGWTSNGTSPACTVDVNECDSAVPHCSKDPEVQCINLPGSYACGQCPHGYTGNGHYCRDVDECETNNGGCSSSPFVPCINTRGSVKCGPCPFGYTGDGRFCVRSTDQAVGPITTQRCDNQNPCHPLAICIERQYSISCICPPRYSGNGYGPFGCMASNNTVDGCTVNPCLNGGTCINVGAFGSRCDCPPGTIQPRCSRAITPCSPNPCQNGGTCVQINRSQYRCACPSNRNGRNCQLEVRACGGVLNTYNGTLKFPLSGAYPDNSRCAWLIKTDEDKVLNVTITKFHLEQSRECRFDWLQIHDGRSSASHMIGRFCGNELPKDGNIVSTQNMLYLWFRSDNSSAHDGFELTWNSTDPVCGGDISIASHGIIASPGSPGNYPPNRDCIWRLTAPTDKRIQLHFFTLQIEAHEDCRYDYLAIYNGPSTDGDLLEKFCNTTHPEPLTSPSNELTLQFHTDEDGADTGFQIHYSLVEGIQGCGGTFTALNGEFGSPIQNGQYPKNLECHYLIRMPRRNETGIKLTFLSFNLESSTNCNFDYVEIYDGKNEIAPKVGRWCGNRIPPSYSSKSGEVLVVFRSDFSFGGDGFRLKYETLCGGRFEDDNSIITSPWWPKNYEDNKYCAYDIEAPLGKAIVLNFTDFDIENDCDFDSLTIYDGVDANSTKIGSYCGTRKPPTAISTLNHMHLIFQTDLSNTGPGFRATYSFIGAGCGGIIKKLNLTISPPSNDDGYVHSSNCKWIIVAPVGFMVQLTFVSFELETSQTCLYDYVSVYDNIIANETSDIRPIGKYCGTEKPPVMMSSSRAITIIFQSDESVNGQGFSATYDFINGRNLCGGNFYGLSGTITSPNYPDRYPPSRNCNYVINAPNGKQIQLHVEAFSLEESNGCGFDSLEIRNGQNDKSPLLGTFCGTEILPRFKSFSNHIFLKFKTDSSNELSGFKISYDTSSSGCGGLFTNTQSGTLTSPNYPEPYPANMQCDYTVQVARGSTIILLLTDIQMEQSSECSYDYISIYDGPNAASKLIGTYCNAEQLLQMESTSNIVFIRLVTDVNNQGRGFELKFSANCKRQINDLRGAIESPNFPGNYPHYANCEWKIIPPLGNRIFLEFSHFDLEHSWDEDGKLSSCIFDHLTVEERDVSDSIIRTDRYCQIMPKPINTTYTVVIKFESDFSNTGGGFHLEYEVQGCGGFLNRPEGTFSSPNYPRPYPHDMHCQWIIEVEYGHLVEITFTDFDFEATPDCTQDGLFITNDANATKIIQRFCGSMHNQKGTTTSATNKVYVHFYSDMSYAGRGFQATYKSIAAKCGGTFSIAEGNITSPKYPMNYEPNTYCQWLLRTESSHSVLLKFTDFDLEDDCSSDSVQVYDGPEKRADKLLFKSCGSQIIGSDATNQTKRPGFTEPLKSTANEMLVVMEADHGVEAKGFAAEYTTSCGSKIVTSSSGMLEIGHNLRWIADRCEWVITAQNPEQHVALTILHIENEPIIQKLVARMSNQTEAQCTRKIFIHDGTSTKAPKVQEICSSTHPPTIISEGNSLTVALDETVENDYAFTFDLKASYSVIDSECGGEFTSVSGQIASPAYPKTYKNNIECEWTIKASLGNEMVASITMLDIDETEHCNGDYLEVRETNSVGKLIGVYCGKQIPPALSPTNTYWLKFRSDNDAVGRGFLLEYNYAKLIEQTGTDGLITSPMYPTYIYYTIGSYGWRITVKSEFVVRIFVDDCILKRDSIISIYDGYDSSSDLLTNIENDKLPLESILSTTNVIYVEFEISTMSESKFELRWSEVEKSVADLEKNATNTLNCTVNSVVTVSETDRIQLSSPGYPTGYDSNLNCVWTFLPAKPGYHVDLSFFVLDLEVTPNCLADYIRIRSGQDLQNIDLESIDNTRMCSLSQVLRGNRYHGAPNLRVKFQSDYSNNRTGFNSMILLDCGGLLDGPHGEITNQMTVSNGTHYTMNDTCTWEITVQTGRTIQFEFNKLNLARHDDGACNSYIIIRNGVHDDSPFLGVGKYCNGISTIPATSSNKAIVQFARNIISKHTNEFILKYQQVEHECGGSHTLDYSKESVTISTPNYPNIPSPHIECVWRVTAPNGELFRMEFLDRFDLTPSINCIKEFIEIREGTTTTAPIIGRYCRDKPQPIYTASNMVRLMYFTDVSVPRNGFKVKVSFARCGKSIVANSGFVQSPGFPANGAYPPSASCDYHITGRLGTTVNITFLDLDLPEARNCSEVDHIVIYSMLRKVGGNTTYSEVRTICGDTKPDSILTFSSSALVRFITTSSDSHMFGGFRFKFESSIDTCGARTEASSGIIQSPGYPSSPDATKYCEWRITVPKGRRIRLDVLDFDVKQSLAAGFAGRVFYNSDQSRISLYNDFNMYSLMHVLYMNNETSATYYSSDNIMSISALIRRSNAGYRGFKFRFTSNEPSACVGNLNGMQGSINSPENLTRYYCEFIRSDHTPLIQSQPNVGTLAIKVFEEILNTNRTQACTPNLPAGFAFVFSNNDRRLYYTKCPSKYENLVTPFANAKLILRSLMSRKYHFTYKVHACGGLLSSATTRIAVPSGLVNNYGELDCAWQYTTNIDRNIQMIVNAPQMNCETEWLTIYRGSSTNRPIASKICGDSQTTNRTIFLQGQHAFVVYHSDSYSTASAAALQIEIVTSNGMCGGVIEVANSLFSSPRNGTKYLPNTECEWILRAHSGYHIGLTFVNRFMIEKSPACTKDYLKVFDKRDGEFREIAKICGREFPPFLNSTGQEMKVLFHTDGTGDGDGFTAKWVENCGGVFRATNKPQYITSPRYPDPYPRRSYCNYSIVANESESVSVRFLTFDLEAGSHLCNFDNITIYKVSQYGWPTTEEVGTYCRNGSVASTFRYTNRIDIVFRTDSFIERSGFKFEYSTDRCGGNITESMQIGSINEDNTEVYLPMTTCVWFVTAPSDKKILIRFEQFELEYLLGCQLDYVEIFEGHRSIADKRKARLCGSLTGHAPAVSVDSNEATIKFATDASVQEKGFRALILFTKNCNEYINLTASNPRYILNKLTDQYEPLLNCEYFISAPKGYFIQAKFNQMHLTPCTTTDTNNNSCTCDYLNVRDGAGPFGELFGTFCGHSTPADMLTTSGDMYIQFVSDQISSGTGFSVGLEMIPSPCGQTNYHLNDSMNSVNIQSPMDGDQYKANINCLWTLSADDGKLIDVKFEKFELQSDGNNKCMKDYLEISDEQSKNIINEGLGQNTIFSGSPQSKNQYFYWGKQWPTAAHRYCGSGLPVDYLSSSKIIYVHFKSDNDIQMNGFRFNAKVFSECARNYTALQGRLYGKSLSDCEQYITVPENYTITLYFASLDFRTSQECTENSAPLTVYDGRNNGLLKFYCSDAIPKPLFTSTNQLRLKFRNITVAYVLNELYDVTYLASDKGRGCGGELYNYGGTFSSPGYPNTYRNNSDCTWTISVPMNLYVAVHFQVFDMGPQATCERNYVKIYEQSANIAPTKFCGKDVPAPYKAKSNQLKVRFKSDVNFVGTGWVANFMAVHENSIINNF